MRLKSSEVLRMSDVPNQLKWKLCWRIHYQETKGMQKTKADFDVLSVKKIERACH